MTRHLVSKSRDCWWGACISQMHSLFHHYKCALEAQCSWVGQLGKTYGEMLSKTWHTYKLWKWTNLLKDK